MDIKDMRRINVDDLKKGDKFRKRPTTLNPLYTVVSVRGDEITIKSNVTGISRLNKKVIKVVYLQVKNDNDQ